MTLEELKQRIDDYIGLVSEINNRGNYTARLTYFFNEIELFNLTIGNYGEGWEFADCSIALPNSRKVLFRIHESEK